MKGEDKGRAWTGAGLFVLALAVRLLYLLEASGSPTFLAPIVDANSYDLHARALAAGEGLASDFFWQAFFYPYFLSLVYALSGASILWAKVIQVVLGSLVCVLVHRLGEAAFDRRTGLWAGLITALYGPLVFFEGELLATGWAAFFAVTLVLLFLKAERGKGMWICLSLGMCGGLSVVTRATFFPFFAAAGLWLLLALRRSSMAWKGVAERGGLLLAGFLLVTGVWALQPYLVTGRFSPLPESGPLNLYIGNSPEMTETMTVRPGSEWEELLYLPRRHGAKGWRGEQAFFMERFRAYVAARPFHYLGRLAFKAVHFSSSREIPSNFDPYGARDHSWILSALFWKALGFGFPFGVLLPLALLGLVRSRFRIPSFMALFLVLYPLAVILVFVTARYRAPVIPVLAPLAAAGLLWVKETAVSRDWKRVAVLVSGSAAVAVLASLAGPFAAEQVNYRAEMHYCLGMRSLSQDLLPEAVPHLEEALRLDPEYNDARILLGQALDRQGRSGEAVALYEKALALDPEFGPAHHNLGNALMGLGKVQEAVAHYYEALRLNPFKEDHYLNLALALSRLGDLGTAKECCKKALEINPDRALTYNNLGVVLSRMGKTGEAIEAYRKAASLSPKAATHLNLALLLAGEGEGEASAVNLRKALRLAEAEEDRALADRIRGMMEEGE